MIKNPDFLEEFEKKFIAQDILTYDKAMSLLEGMWEEALGLGVIHPEDVLEGIQKNIRIARILRACSKNC